MKQYRKIPLLLTAFLFVLAGMLYLKQISDGQEETKAPEEAQGYNWTIRLTETDAGEQTQGQTGQDSAENTLADTGQENREFAGTDVSGESGRPSENEAAEDRININTAGVEALITLPMIGEKRAEAIIRYRNEHGPFQSPEEITAVAGIGNGIYKRIKDRIRV